MGFEHISIIFPHFGHFPIIFPSFSSPSKSRVRAPPPSPPCHGGRQSPPPWLWPWSLQPRPWAMAAIGNLSGIPWQMVDNYWFPIPPMCQKAEIYANIPKKSSHLRYIFPIPPICQFVKSFSASWNRRPIGQRDFGVRHPLRCKEKPWCQRLRFDFLSPLQRVPKSVISFFLTNIVSFSKVIQ